MKNFFSGLTLLALFSTAPASANFLKKFTDSIPNPETMLDKNQGETKSYQDKINNKTNNNSPVNNQSDPFGNSKNFEDTASKFNLNDLSPSGANGMCVFKNVDMENTFYKKNIAPANTATGKFTWEVLKCLSACTSYECIKQKETWRNVYTKETGRMHEADCGTQRCEYVKSVLGYFKPRVTPEMTWLNKDGTCDFSYINRVKCPGHDKKYPEMINNRNGCYMTKKEDSEYERRGWTYVVIAGPFACPSDYVKG